MMNVLIEIMALMVSIVYVIGGGAFFALSYFTVLMEVEAARVKYKMNAPMVILLKIFAVCLLFVATIAWPVTCLCLYLKE